ncbi:helix-turn-helix domain-containing protein [Nocardiopsis ansamitocini]|uniref:MerR family transcriptional regulator n=1 Tax=Nocardiopsis ansamitocini TaxID=1670832 RepID=A0A9W6P6Z4_9ACTN|nr:helix-turn-helix domain-containing protein [Nocardiopsis ansamitocini]GLU48281.1 MerR family transcriptional regulator [Nocardiopsis ansamitocini]
MHVAQQLYYSPDQVADLLGLHVRTVRAYVRDGRLKATRVGKQYRISHEDLEVFVGGRAPTSARKARHVEVSSIVQVEAIGPEETMRLTNTVMAVVGGRQGTTGDHLRVETVYDEERASLKIIVLGSPETTADLLKVISTLTEQPE